MGTRHQAKAEKNEKTGWRRVEVAEACLNHLKAFKTFHTFFDFRLIFFHITCSLRAKSFLQSTAKIIYYYILDAVFCFCRATQSKKGT